MKILLSREGNDLPTASEETQGVITATAFLSPAPAIDPTFAVGGTFCRGSMVKCLLYRCGLPR